MIKKRKSKGDKFDKMINERSQEDKLVCVILEYKNKFGMEYFKEIKLK